MQHHARATRASTVFRVSALAVFRLITSSYLVGACTRKVGGLLALEDAIDVLRRSPAARNGARSAHDGGPHPFGRRGKDLSQPTAMVAATTAQAKLAGLWIERSEQTRKQPDEMSDAEIAAILRGNPN